MAKLYTKKSYVAGGTYHIFNRGNNKSTIFLSPVDYWVFRRLARRARDRVGSTIKFIAFSLIPNHYHLEITQMNERDITKFMRSLMCSYSSYFNKKYGREGSICCGVYCARYLATEREIIEVKEYILANPIEAGLIGWKHVGTNI